MLLFRFSVKFHHCLSVCSKTIKLKKTRANEFPLVYLILVSPADVEPPELDSLLDTIDTGLGFRDEATELQLASDAVNWHCVDNRCKDDDDDCDWIDCVDGFDDGEQLDCVTFGTLSVSQLTIIL